MRSPETAQERLTRQFYRWEKRGRGWRVWDQPVELEPPFSPFFHYDPGGAAPLDDGRTPTLLSRIAGNVLGSAPDRARPTDVPELPGRDEEELLPLWPEGSGIVELRLVLPREQVVTGETAERFLLGLSYCTHPIGFEVIGLPQTIRVQIACRAEDGDQVRRQLRAYFPAVVAEETEGFLADLWNEGGSREGLVIEFGFSNEFMRPLRVYSRFDTDPLTAVAGALDDLREGELGLLQVLFQAAKNPWAESILRAVTDWEGKPFFADAPEMVALARRKVSQALFAAVIRVACRSPDRGRAWEIAKSLGAALRQFDDPASNGLIPLANDGYPDEAHGRDVTERRSRRTGMLLNTEELLSLVHLPSASVRAEKLQRAEKKSKAAPAGAAGHRLILGENVHAGKTATVGLSPEQRVRHTYIVGASGTGKSTLLLNLIVQDIRNGEGVAVLDPHGDLIDEILGRVPEERFEDVVLLDPSDEAFPVGFNILSAHSELEKNLLASDLVGVFRRLSTSWGDQMTSVLGNAILAFLESDRGGTLADLRRFLVEADFRRAFLETVRDEEVVYYWTKEFPLLSGKPQAPLLTRLDTFLRPKLIRYMVCQKANLLNFEEIMNRGRIFLGKLAQGAIGQENAYLLGALLVAKMHQLTMGRQELSESERRNFYLYIDEFQNFVTPSMAQILSGARKYRLGFTLAHQELRQLWNQSTDVASAVISNPCTRVCFRLGDFDAAKLAEGFSFFDARDLQNLGVGEAICRIERAEYDFNLKTHLLADVDAAVARERKERILGRSREKYARKRQEVEVELARDRAPVKPPVPLRPATAGATTEGEPGPPAEPVRPGPAFEAAKPPGRKKAKAVKLPSESPLLGRGGREHKRLQYLVKRLAEQRAYMTVIEKQISGGAGSIDVALQKGDWKIACEISVTSTSEQELGNIRKCLEAGYEPVVLLSTDSRFLKKVRELVSGQLGPENAEKVLFLEPDEVVSLLDTVEAQTAGTEKTIGGYRVRTEFRPLGREEKEGRVKELLKTLFRRRKPPQ